jgi:hypothetical protein
VFVSDKDAVAVGGFTLGVIPGFGLHDPKANKNIVSSNLNLKRYRRITAGFVNLPFCMAASLISLSAIE